MKTQIYLMNAQSELFIYICIQKAKVKFLHYHVNGYDILHVYFMKLFMCGSFNLFNER